MADFVWILPNLVADSLGKHGIAFSYRIPLPHATDEIVSELVGNRLWVLLRGGTDRLFLTISVLSADRITEGGTSSGYLIKTNRLSSFKISESYSSAAPYETSNFQELATGIHPIDEAKVKHLCSTLQRNLRARLVAPDKRLLSPIKIEPLPTTDLMRARAAIVALTSAINFDEVWGNPSSGTPLPFAYFARDLLGRYDPINDPDRLLDELDPLTVLTAGGVDQSHLALANSDIDILFAPINPAEVYSRRFLASGKPFDLDSALKKTEHAEHVHQAMLRDVAAFLLANGLAPLQSHSVDLAYILRKDFLIVEIKSATVENLYAQAARGAFQLAWYENEISTEYGNISTRLLLHSVGDKNLEGRISRVLESLGIIPLFYFPDEEWPNRVPGLPL